MTRRSTTSPFVTLIAGLWALTAPGALAQDAERGEEVFNRCAACHEIGPEADIRVGPPLTGVVGRQAGRHAGFDYSDAMVAAGEAGLVWSEETLFEYLAGPTDFLRAYLGDDSARAKMAFQLRDKQDRRDVIAYLATFNESGQEAAQAPIPAEPVQTASTELCVRNRDTHTHVFAAEAEGAERQVTTLAPGERLCIETRKSDARGVVSVYDSEDAFEGCSRLVPVGRTEDMLKYVDFDRCFWSSNT